jgi:hypothetical protein
MMGGSNAEIELVESPSRRSFLEGGSAVLAGTAFVSFMANAQQPEDQENLNRQSAVIAG